MTTLEEFNKVLTSNVKNNNGLVLHSLQEGIYRYQASFKYNNYWFEVRRYKREMDARYDAGRKYKKGHLWYFYFNGKVGVLDIDSNNIFQIPEPLLALIAKKKKQEEVKKHKKEVKKFENNINLTSFLGKLDVEMEKELEIEILETEAFITWHNAFLRVVVEKNIFKLYTSSNEKKCSVKFFEGNEEEAFSILKGIV
jgi:hypothetical protein